MANVLAELFQNTANAIREKTGDSGTMKPAEFPDKIKAIAVGGESANLVPLTVTENGTYYPPKSTVEVGNTYTFKTAYTQEELKALYDSALYHSDDGVWATLFGNLDGTGDAFGVMYQYGMYGAFVASGLAWIPEALASQIGSSEGWHQGADISSMTKLSETPSFALSSNYASGVEDLALLDVLFELPSVADGFSKVTVDVDCGEDVNLISLTVTENGKYYPSMDEADGFSEVIVDVKAQAPSEEPNPFIRLPNPEQIPDALVNDFVWNPNGDRLLIIGSAGAYLYDTTTTPYTFLEVLSQSNTTTVTDASYSLDGTRLFLIQNATYSTDKTSVRTYDTTTTPYTLITGLIPSTYTTTSYMGSSLHCGLSPNGELLCITGYKGYVIFDTTKTPYTVLKAVNNTEGAPQFATFDPTGKWLYIGAQKKLHSQTITGASSSVTYDYNTIRYVIGENKSLTLDLMTGFDRADMVGWIAFRGDLQIGAVDLGRKIMTFDDYTYTRKLRFEIRDMTGPWEDAGVDKTGQFIVASDNNKVLKTTKITDKGILFYELAPDFSNEARTCRFSPDNKKLFVGTGNAPYVYIYDVSESI